jgi:hypothetical protein
MAKPRYMTGSSPHSESLLKCLESTLISAALLTCTNSTVDLTGNLRMLSDISHTTTGLKSALMKPLIPFFKKNRAGAVIPIRRHGRF